MTTRKTPAKKKAVAKRSGLSASGRGKGRVTKAVFHTPQWTTACPDWERRIVARMSLSPCDPLFPDEAKDGLEVFGALAMVDLGRKPDDSFYTFAEVCAPWTNDFVSAVFGSYCGQSGHPLEGRRLIKEFFLLISKKNAKALALDTPIPTPSGWTTMGEVKVGDRVYGADGKPCRVTATSEVYTDHKCYRLGFSNGESVVADAGHLWVTRALADSPGAFGVAGGDLSSRKVRTRTTQEIADTLTRPHDGARNHSMSMPAPLIGRKAKLPVAPYTLGAWLGDGHSASAKITLHADDEEILAAIREDGWPVRYASNNGSSANTYALSDDDRSQSARNCSLAAKLRACGVLNAKHIPEVYLRASLEQRLALLQGLMDTDGTINKTGRVLSFCNTNDAISRGFSELLATFGIKHSVTRRENAWVVQFMAFRDEVPCFRLARKLSRMRYRERSTARSSSVQFVSAEEVPSVPVKCIMVDSHDHQFLFGRTMLPTHNSTIAAGIMLTALVRNWRDEAEFLILSPTKEIADNSFKPIAAAIRADEELDALLQVQDHIRTITHRVTKATLKVVAADSQTVSGKKAVGILVDELHEFGKVPSAGTMLTEATGGLMSRPEGFVIYLTTQSSEPPAGVFKEKLAYARGVRDGKINDPAFYPILYEFPDSYLKSGKPIEPAHYYITNPNMGRSVDEPTLIRLLAQAEQVSKAELQDKNAKHLNIEVGLRAANDNWAGADLWEGAALWREPSLTALLQLSEVVCVGVDGGGLDDLLGMCVLGRSREQYATWIPPHEDPETGEMKPGYMAMRNRWYAWFRAWAHPIVLDRRKEIAPRLLDFSKQKELVVVEEMGQDAEQMAKIIKRIFDAGLLDKVGYDPNGIAALVDANLQVGLPEDKMVTVNQGWRLAAAITATERKLSEAGLHHGGSGLMNWCVGNAKVKLAGNSKVITKQISGSAKIDPLMALFNAVALMSLNPPAAYSTQDFSNMLIAG